MARGIEVDWVVIRVHSVRKVVAVVATAVVAAVLLVLAYNRINLPPDARAQIAIERAQAAHEQVKESPLPEAWQQEIAQAEEQLEAARKAFGADSWHQAINLAEAARTRFENFLGANKYKVVGVGQIFSFEGRVTVQRAGDSDWSDAHKSMPVFNGDFVKTGRDGSSEILFSDGSLYRIAPNSLLEIHQPTGQSGGTESGTVKMVVGRINVYTSGSSSTVTTDTTETHVERDSRVSVDVAEEDNRTTVAAYSGRARVRNPKGQEVVVATREQVAAATDGSFEQKKSIPLSPKLTGPPNNSVFDLEREPLIGLNWKNFGEVQSAHLQVSRSKKFYPDQLDVDSQTRRPDGARLRAVATGTYFWRVAVSNVDGLQSEWSPLGRFRIVSSDRRLLPEDRTPPMLEVAKAQQLGHMFIVEGQTEVGARVSINGEPVELEAEGRFRKAVEVTQEGMNELVIISVDPSGNRSEHREQVFVEF